MRTLTHVVQTPKGEYTIVKQPKDWLIRHGCGAWERYLEVTMPHDMSGMILVKEDGKILVTPKVLRVREA